MRFFNIYYKLVIYPLIFKRATTIILCKYKRDNYLNLFIYRLITLLNTLGKVLKAIIIKRIRIIIKMHTLLPRTQINARRIKLIKIAFQLIINKIYTI